MTNLSQPFATPASGLFPESFTDALKDCIHACGGSKAVGVQLWPEKSPDAAHRLLLGCLNEDRPERLSPDQVVFVLRLARERGCHIGAAYLMRQLGYADPVPVEPRDEMADLQRHFLAAVDMQRQILERMEHLQPLGTTPAAHRPGPLRAA